jgi:predicted nucleotidyltransferase component of viral defense system
MEANVYNQLQIREIFHLEFLRWLVRKVKAQNYALKGGINLRFFFQSLRYSEDMDLDAYGIRKDVLLDAVMGILESTSFRNALMAFGIERIIPPDILKAKQTETTQRFKTHLITYAGEDLFTKIEFSKRGFKGEITVEPVLDSILREYKMPPLLIPHYIIEAAISQKISALQARIVTQARDIFDLYILSSQYKPTEEKVVKIKSSIMKQVQEKIFAMEFEVFRDAVISYLSVADHNTYDKPDVWDEIKLKVVHFLEELGEKNG